MSKFIGKGTFSAGSASDCSVNFVDSNNTGIYESSTGVMNLVAGGTSLIQLSSTSALLQLGADLNSNKITNMATPTTGTDGANKTYVDTKVSSISYSAGVGLSLSSNTFSAVGSSTIISASGGLAVNSSSTANQILLSSGTVGTASTFGALPLGNSNSVTGTLSVSNGGTGATTFTSTGILIGNGTSAVQTSSTTLNSAGTMVMAGGFFVSTRLVTTSTNVTVSATDYLVIVNNSATVSVSLPVASSNAGRKLVIVKTGSAPTLAVNVTPNGSDTINGSLTSVPLVTQYSRVSLVCDGVSSWYVE